MSDTMARRCPRCGKRPIDPQLRECPDCLVLFSSDSGPGPALTPEQLRLLAGLVLTSWKFWMLVAVMVGASAWGISQVAERMIDLRAQAYLNSLEQRATNHIAFASAQISNQIALELRQPRIRSMIELAAIQNAKGLLTNSIWPGVTEFQNGVDQANARLARASNNLARLEEEVRAAQILAADATNVAPPVVATEPATVPAPVVPATPAKLILVDRNVTRSGSGYLLTLSFKASNNTPIGAVDLVAGTFRQTAKILNFACVGSGSSDPAVMNETGDAARLRFTISGSEPPLLALELSAATIVKLTGDALQQELTVPVAADRLQLPTGSQ